MFQVQSGKASVFCAAWRIIKRRVSFEESNDGCAVIERQQFAVAPDAAAIPRIMRGSARIPEFRQIARLFNGFQRAINFQRTAASRAKVNLFARAIARATGRQDATLYGFRAGPDGCRYLNFRARADSTYFSKEHIVEERG